MEIRLPEDVRIIIETLERHGHEAYAVGGCVRDLFLAREPKDWDITTSARPEEMKGYFRKTIDTGIQHGTVTVMRYGVGYEVTTYRLDGVYSDGRHPESVTFTGDLSEDLKRRDFTINAMAYNARTGVVDLFSGQEDLKARVVRAVGNPVERFTEDALRIMRCIRFAAQLDFCIDPATFEAAKQLSKNLQMISRERVRDELMKIILSDHPDFLDKMAEIGAMDALIPGFTAGNTAVYDWMKRLPKEDALRLAALLYRKEESGEALSKKADRILRELRFDNDTRTETMHLLKCMKLSWGTDEKAFRHALSEIKKEVFPSYIMLRMAEALPEEEEMLAFGEKAYREVLESGAAVSLKELALTGNDLLKLGVKPGKTVGLLLNYLLRVVLDDPAANTKEKLTEEVLNSGEFNEST